jgi:hypothetical protein
VLETRIPTQAHSVLEKAKHRQNNKYYGTPKSIYESVVRLRKQSSPCTPFITRHAKREVYVEGRRWG